MLPLENESLEVARDARLFFRWIRQGMLTVEQARRDLLPTTKQRESLEADCDSNLLQALHRRTATWNALLRMLEAQRQRESVAIGNVGSESRSQRTLRACG